MTFSKPMRRCKNHVLKPFRLWFLLVVFSCLANCRKSEPKPAVRPAAMPPIADSIVVPAAMDTPPNTETNQPEDGIQRDYDSAGIEVEIDSILRARDSLVSLESVLEICDSVFSDSIFRAVKYYAPGYSSHITDSAFIYGAKKVTRRAYANILAYQRAFALNQYNRDARPRLIDTLEIPSPDSGKGLSSPAPSNYLQEGEFFFIGGSPLIQHEEPASESVARDSQGNVRVTYRVDEAENTKKLLASLLYSTGGKLHVGFDRGSIKYDVGPMEIHGIGTLIHRFENPVPVFLLTKNGAIRGDLESIDVKMGRDFICGVSDNPIVKIASVLSPDEKILGIYIPYASKPPATCVLKRGKRSWTLDLNGDQIPDLGCEMKPFVGCMDDTLYSMTWFVNVNGKWKKLDSGSEADCT